MKIRYNVYIISVVFLLLIQPLISGCTTTATKELYEKDLYKEEAGLIGQNLFRDKGKFITTEEAEEIKGYLKWLSQTR